MAGLLFSHAALAADLVAIKPGLMCRDPAALAKLTLPDGSSRAAGANARSADAKIKQDGGCIDFPPGARVVLQTARKRTSIVSYDANDGRGVSTFVVPNIDFSAAANGEPDSSASNGNDPAAKFFAAVNKQCPQQGWNEHLLSHTEQGPVDKVYAAMTPAQQAAAQKEADSRCQDSGGMSCPNDAIFAYMVKTGHLESMVRAVCAVKAPSE
jgi:hypothetical protein